MHRLVVSASKLDRALDDVHVASEPGVVQPSGLVVGSSIVPRACTKIVHRQPVAQENDSRNDANPMFREPRDDLVVDERNARPARLQTGFEAAWQPIVRGRAAIAKVQ